MHYRSWHVLAALALVTVTLALVSVQTVRQEALVRKNFVINTHRAVASLVSARVSDTLAASDRAIADAASTRYSSAGGLFEALERLEQAYPWLGPLVVERVGESAGDAPLDGVMSLQTPGTFAFTFAAAEREELQFGRSDRAGGLYERAAATAPTSARRLQALNGLARTAFGTRRIDQAVAASKTMVAEADSLDPAHARWQMVARDRLVQIHFDLGDTPSGAQHAIEFRQFLTRYRFLLDQEAIHFYSQRLAARIIPGVLNPGQQQPWQKLADREVRLELMHVALGTGLAPPVPRLRRIPIDHPGEPRIAVTYSLETAALLPLVEQTLRAQGVSSDLDVAIVDAESGGVPLAGAVSIPADATRATGPLASWPQLHVVAFPRDRSLDEVAARDVTRYALWLMLVFATIVAALALAARGVARELKLSQLRTDFVASVSHELKTPLSLIRMFAESLREGWVADAQKQDYYEIITRESERLTGLIDNVLDFSRIESGTRRYLFAVVDLRQLVVELLARYEFHLRAANVALDREMPDDPVYARIDAAAIEQVMVNLLSNAVKYMGHATGQPRRVLVSLGHDDGRILLRVSDTGIGMTDIECGRVFKRFYRADDDRVRAVPGSGLGLTLVKAHIEAHAGCVVVHSVPDKGSTVNVSLPLVTQGTQA